MKLSEIKQILSSGQIRLTKSLGQNFLHDGNQLRRIVSAAELTGTDRVLEIGPGLGPLTELLVAHAVEVLAIEKDRRLCEWLQGRCGLNPNLTLVQGDALEYLRRERVDWSDWILVANLPYSVASPILVELAQAPAPPKKLVATVQLEVAQRLMSSAGERCYGVLALLMQLRYEPRGWFKIPAACFYPAPEVDSACFTMVRRSSALLPRNESRVFDAIVKRGFSQRRKMMLKLLKEDWAVENLQKAFHRAQISTQARAEEVTLLQFVELTRLLHDPPEGG